MERARKRTKLFAGRRRKRSLTISIGTVVISDDLEARVCAFGEAGFEIFFFSGKFGEEERKKWELSALTEWLEERRR